MLVGSSSVDCWSLMLDFLHHRENYLELQQIVVFLLWGIWKARNALLFEQPNQDFAHIIFSALMALNDFKDATTKRNNPSHPQPPMILS